MWKKIRIPLIILIAGTLLTVFFSWQLNFLNVPLRLALEKLSGQNITFQEINYRLFNRVTIDHLTIGQHFRCKSVTVYLNPWILLRNINKPERAILRVHLSQPWIEADGEFLDMLNKMSRQQDDAPSGDMRVSWDKAEIANRVLPIKQLSGQVKIAKTINGKMSGKVRGQQLNISITEQEAG